MESAVQSTTIDREALAGEYLPMALGLARRWCVRTDRAWWADEAEGAALDGLMVALGRWEAGGASGSFPALLHACVAMRCRKSYQSWARGRLVNTPDDWSDGAIVDDRAPPVGEDTERREGVIAIKAAWSSIEAREGNRNRDSTRAFRLVFGLPERGRKGRSSRSSYLPPMDTKAAARKLGRSAPWVERQCEGYVEEIRRQVAG